ncbi:MAG: hypothetical protein QOG23_3022 [Blastocatellia bacterium]|jgi:hypothetical protein|nr:hypothetical protein [Blastocatellia bacterium]
MHLGALPTSRANAPETDDTLLPHYLAPKKLAFAAQISEYGRLIFKPGPFVCLDALNAKGFSQDFNHSVEK